LTLAVSDDGVAALAAAIFVSTLIAVALGGPRIVIAQAAVAAILVVTVASPEAGIQRLIDAFVGVGVALSFSQLLFSPEPVALVRRAAATALSRIADGLRLTADALERDDDELGERALSELRAVRDQLANLARMRAASSRVARRSAVWRSRRAPLVQENEQTGYLDLLGGSCLVMTREALMTSTEDRSVLAREVSAFADVLSNLAREPGERGTRQDAVNQVMEIGRRAAAIEDDADVLLASVTVTMRMVCVDVMSFAGVDPDEAFDAVQEGVGEFDVPSPPPTSRIPFRPSQS
jgi:hypothetical protein